MVNRSVNGWILFSSVYWIFHNPWNYFIIMFVVLAICVALVSAIVFCWMMSASYFGNMFATFITIVVAALLLWGINSWLGEPTEQELKHFETQRRDKG